LALHVNADEAFKETRYIYALDSEFNYSGKISFTKESITIQYNKPKKQNITYNKDDDDIKKAYFFTILNAIHGNDERMMLEFFTKKKELGVSVLFPNDMLSDFIQKVEYKKSGKELKFLKIYMQNDDWILIETLR
jgi:hypothetical protein